MKYVREFEGLRGIMAWWVVVGHWSTTAPIPYTIAKTKLFNGYAVDVFIILSGFAIAALIDKRPEHYSLYLSRRIFRIFPVYLFFLALSVLFAPLALETWLGAPEGYMKGFRIRIATDSLEQFWPHLGAHLVALQGLVPPALLPNTDFAFLGQAWSISLEWQFYLIAPLMIACLRPSSSMVRLLWLLVIAVLMVGISPLMPNGFLGRSLHNFAVGILSFFFLKERFNGNAYLQFPVIPIVIFGLPFLLLLKTAAVLPYAIWLLVMVIVIVTHEKGAKVFQTGSRLLTHPLALKMGNMAYSVYLSHMLVIVMALNVLKNRGLSDVVFSLALLTLTVLGTFVISTLTYRLIELPFHNFGRSLSDRRLPRAVSPE